MPPRFNVVTTVRSQTKGDWILKAHPGLSQEKLSYAVVEDIAKEGAFDEVYISLSLFVSMGQLLTDKVVKTTPFDYVIHTASPFHFKFSDPVKEILDPAIKGTEGILKAIKASAPTVKRVVITSSFAAIVNVPHKQLYDESVWNPVTWEEAIKDKALTYRASKVRPFRCLI
jgi:nucleoside-diphosphate-sugar epimerase